MVSETGPWLNNNCVLHVSLIVTGGTAFLAFGSLRCHRWRWGGVRVVGLTVFGFRCPTNIIITPDLLWYPHYWNVWDIFLYCFMMLGTFSTILLLYFFFSNWKQGSSVGRICRRRGHRGLPWRQLVMPPVALGSLNLRSSVFFGLQGSINMTITPDLPW